MTSTTSFKNKLKQAFSIFKWEVRSCAGTITVYSILASVAFIILLTLCVFVYGAAENSDVYLYSNAYTPNYYMEFFQSVYTTVINLLTAVFTIIYTIKVFSYLHNKRKEDMYGSLPVGRITLYFTKAASALLFSLVPALFFLGIMSIVSVCMGTPVLAEVSQQYINLIIGTLACVAAYGLISICCGTTFNSVVMFIAVCVAYPLSFMFVKGTIEGFFTGFYSDALNQSFLGGALNPLAAYSGENIIYWLIFTLVCVIGSAFLIKKRKAERAQSSFAYYLPCHIVKVLVAFLSGMFFGSLFGWLNIFGNGFIAFIFGFVIGSVPAFIICHLLFYKGFSRLLKTSIPLGGLIVVTILGMAFCAFDPIGYNSYVPNADEIESAGFVDCDYSYFNYDSNSFKNLSTDFSGKEDVENITEAQNIIVEEVKKDEVSDKFGDVWSSMINNVRDYSTGDSYCFAYKLKNGSTVTRSYNDDMYFDDDNYDFTYSYDRFYDVADEIRNKKIYFERHSTLSSATKDDIEICAVTGAKDQDITDSVYGATAIKYVVDDESFNYESFEKIQAAYLKDLMADKDENTLALYGMRNLSDLQAYDGSYGDDAIDLYDDAYYYEGYEGLFNYESIFRNAKKKYPEIVCAISFNQSSGDIEEVFDFYTYEEVFLVPKDYTNTINALLEEGVLVEVGDKLFIN